MRFGLVTGTVVACGLSRSAAAQPLTRFRFVAPAEERACPSEEGMRARVVAHLGYDPFTGLTPPSGRSGAMMAVMP
jgi:hypothetical protein